MADTQVRQINVVVQTGGDSDLKAIAASLGGVNQAAQGLLSQFGGLKNAFVGYLAVLKVQQLAEISDQFQNLADRLAILTGGTASAREAIQGIVDVANATKQPVEAVGKVYSDLSLETRRFGADSQTVLDLTQLLINTYRLSGKSAEDAAQGTAILARAFTTGSIDARVLRTELRDNLFLGELLGKTFGQNIFKESQQGALTTAQFLQVLYKNADDINNKAQQLTTTFGQSLTQALNNFKLKVFEVNDALGVSTGFALAIQTVADKFTLFLAVAAPVVATFIPELIAGIGSVSVALYALALANPYTAAFTAIGAGILVLVKNFDQFKEYLNEFVAYFDNFAASLIEKAVSLENKLPSFLKSSSLNDSLLIYASGLRTSAQQIKDSYDQISDADIDFLTSESDINQKRAALVAKVPQPEKTLQELLKELNAEYSSGKIDASQYYDALNEFDATKLSREFRDGKINLEQYLTGLDKIRTFKLDQEFNSGYLSFKQFDDAIRQAQIQKLTDELNAGKISLIAYNEQLVQVSNEFLPGAALSSGTSTFLKSIGTVSSNISDAVKDTFTSLETSLEDFIKTGTFNFQKFTQGILDDLLKIIIRATIIRPLAEGILGAFTPGATTVTTTGGAADNITAGAIAAHGAAFDNGGIKKFASGGVVTRATPFAYNNGASKGLMGEAGPEAILPLKRTSGGDLGISGLPPNVYLNINNTNGSDVSTSQSTNSKGEQVLDVMIRDKVRSQINSGGFDKALSSSFGLKRKGS